MDSFLWSIFCVVLFVLGFVLVFYTADGFTRSMQSIAQKWTFHPVALSLFVLGCDVPITALCTVAAFNRYQYLSIGSLIGSSVVSVTLTLCLPLLLFREEPFLKVLAENMKKDDKMQIPSWYFKLLCVLCAIVAAVPIVAKDAYNLLLCGLLCVLCFAAYCTQNFLRYRRCGVLDIHITPKLQPGISGMHELSELRQRQLWVTAGDHDDDATTKGNVLADECYGVDDDDDDTDDYDAIASAKEHDSESLDDAINIMSDDGRIELGQNAMQSSAVAGHADGDEAIQIELADMSKKRRGLRTALPTAIDLAALKNNGTCHKCVAGVGYLVLLMASAQLCVYTAGELATEQGSAGILNENMFAYIVVPLVSNLDIAMYAASAYKASNATGYALDVARLTASTYWNVGLLFGLCGVCFRSVRWRSIEVMNAVFLLLAVMYATLVILNHQFKRVHGMALLTLFAAYCFLNLVLAEIVE